jgi:hypothetical protein
MVLRVKVFESQHSATVLLFTGAVSQDPRTIWGALGQDIILETPGSQPSDAINEIRWEKEGTMVAQMRKDKRSSQQDKSYEILNEGLKIKHLKRNDGGTYNVTVYDTGGKSVLQRAFDLRIQGKSSIPKFLHFDMGVNSKLGNNIYVIYLVLASASGENLIHLSCPSGASSPVRNR